MEGQHASGGGEPDAGAERELRLTALLRDVVAEEGRLAAADLLGVNYKTLKRVLESGRLTSHVRDALERLQASRDHPAGAAGAERGGALERRIERLEDGLTTLMEEPSGEGHGSLSEVLGDEARRRDEDDSSTLAPNREPPVAEPSPAVAGMRPRTAPALRRSFPDVVTVEPAGDDPDVYGEAWPLVEEWRDLRAGHPDRGRGVPWLETELRILTLELTMLDEHGLNAAAGDPATARLRAQGADHLAQDGAPRHAAVSGLGEAAALGAAGMHARTVVEVADARAERPRTMPFSRLARGPHPPDPERDQDSPALPHRRVADSVRAALPPSARRRGARAGCAGGRRRGRPGSDRGERRVAAC